MTAFGLLLIHLVHPAVLLVHLIHLVHLVALVHLLALLLHLVHFLLHLVLRAGVRRGERGQAEGGQDHGCEDLLHEFSFSWGLKTLISRPPPKDLTGRKIAAWTQAKPSCSHGASSGSTSRSTSCSRRCPSAWPGCWCSSACAMHSRARTTGSKASAPGPRCSR